MTKMPKILIYVLLVIFSAAFLGITGTKFLKAPPANKPSTEATTEAAKDEEKATEATTEEKKDNEISHDNEADIKNDQATTENPEDEVDSTRFSDAEDELFQVTLRFFDEYNKDSEEFKVLKALAAQDNTHDYLYFQYSYKGTTSWTCYDYDGKYFREESQKAFEKEYKEDLAISKKSKKDIADGMNIYYAYTKANIRHVNDMY